MQLIIKQQTGKKMIREGRDPERPAALVTAPHGSG